MTESRELQQSPAHAAYVPVAVRDGASGHGVLALASGRRGYTDREGRFWRVDEHVAPEAPWVRGARYLVFETVGAVRRVWTVPDAWWTLDADALEALSEAR